MQTQSKMNKTYFLCLLVIAIVVLRAIKNYTPTPIQDSDLDIDSAPTESGMESVTTGSSKDGIKYGVVGGGAITFNPNKGKKKTTKKKSGASVKNPQGYVVKDKSGNVIQSPQTNVRAN